MPRLLKCWIGKVAFQWNNFDKSCSRKNYLYQKLWAKCYVYMFQRTLAVQLSTRYLVPVMNGRVYFHACGILDVGYRSAVDSFLKPVSKKSNMWYGETDSARRKCKSAWHLPWAAIFSHTSPDRDSRSGFATHCIALQLSKHLAISQEKQRTRPQYTTSRLMSIPGSCFVTDRIWLFEIMPFACESITSF